MSSRFPMQSGRMMHSSSGRASPSPRRGWNGQGERLSSYEPAPPSTSTSTATSQPSNESSKHPGIWCDSCKEQIGDKIRYTCLQCPDFDLCSLCEGKPAILSQHFEGKHVFAKIRDTAAVGGNNAVNSFKKQ